MPCIIKYYLFFALIYQSHVLFYPWDLYNTPNVPLWITISRDIFFLIIIGITIIRNLLKNKIILLKDSVSYTLLSFFVITFIISIFHLTHLSFQEVVQHFLRNTILYTLAFFIAIQYNYDKNKVDYIIIMLGWLVNLSTLITLFLNMLKIPSIGADYWFWDGIRAVGPLENPNNLGLFALFILIFIIEKYKARSFSFSLFILLILSFISIAISASYTAYAGLLVYIGLSIISALRHLQIKTLALILFIILSLSVIFWNMGLFDAAWFKFQVIFVEKDPQYTSLSTRLNNIHELANYYLSSSTMEVFFGRFDTNNYIAKDSQYLNLLYNQGLVVLLLFMFFQIAVICRLFKNKLRYKSDALNNTILFIYGFLMIIGYNMTAYLNRYPLNFFLFLILGIAIKELSVSDKNINYKKNNYSSRGT